MTPRERAEDLVRRFDEPVRDKTNYHVQAMVSMTEEAIEAAVAKEREACAELARKAAGNHPNELKRETARDIEALILARSTASSEYRPQICANCGHKKMMHFWGSRDGCGCRECPGFVLATASSTPQAD